MAPYGGGRDYPPHEPHNHEQEPERIPGVDLFIFILLVVGVIAGILLR